MSTYDNFNTRFDIVTVGGKFNIHVCRLHGPQDLALGLDRPERHYVASVVCYFVELILCSIFSQHFMLAYLQIVIFTVHLFMF